MAYVQLNTAAMLDYMEIHGISGYDMSAMIGRSKNYVNRSIQNGRMLDAAYKILMERLGLPFETFIKKDAKKAERAPAASGLPYALSLEVHPDKVFVALQFNGQELYHAYAKIKGDTEHDLVQSISYAAHMLYKMSEQEYLKNKK